MELFWTCFIKLSLGIIPLHDETKDITKEKGSGKKWGYLIIFKNLLIIETKGKRKFIAINTNS